MRQFNNLISVIAASVSVSLAATALDIDYSKSTTLSTTLRLTGTSPAVTLAAGSASLTFAANAPAYKLTVEAGATTFSIAYDGAVGSNVVTGISIPAGSTYTVPGGKPGAGNVFSFPAGTYVAGDTYQAQQNSLTTQDSNAFSLSQATAANQPIFGKDVDGYNQLCTGGSHTLESAAAALLALTTYASGANPALEILFKIKPVTAAAAGDVFAWSQTGGTSGQTRLAQVATGTGRLSAITVNDAASSTNTNVTRGVDDLANNTLVKASWRFPGSAGGGGLTSRVNDANDQAGTWTPAGNHTPTRFAVGATHDNAFRRQFNGRIYRIVMFSSVLSAAQRTAWFAAL